MITPCFFLGHSMVPMMKPATIGPDAFRSFFNASRCSSEGADSRHLSPSPSSPIVFSVLEAATRFDILRLATSRCRLDHAFAEVLRRILRAAACLRLSALRLANRLAASKRFACGSKSLTSATTRSDHSAARCATCAASKETSFTNSWPPCSTVSPPPCSASLRSSREFTARAVTP